MLTAAGSERLAKLIPLLSSDKPGEVVATAAAIGRTLEAAGATWHDLAAAAARAAEPADPIQGALDDLAHRAKRAADRLWIERLSSFYRSRGFLSRKQIEILSDIEARIARYA